MTNNILLPTSQASKDAHLAERHHHSVNACFKFSLSSWADLAHEARIHFLQQDLYIPIFLATSHDAIPISFLSCSTVLRHVVLSLPGLRFPSGCHVGAVLQWLFLSIRSTWPIHFHRLVLTSKWWSLATSAPRIALVSKTEVLCCCDINTWSIWFCVDPSGDAQICFCPMRWGNMVPVSTRLLTAAKLTRRSPLSFIVPIHCFPFIYSQPSFDSTTFALISPITTTRLCLGTLSRVAWSFSRSYRLGFYTWPITH